MRLVYLKVLQEHDVLRIERYLGVSGGSFNPLYSSPRWAQRMFQRYSIEYSFLIVEGESNEILALLLLQEGFRGWERLRNYNFLLRKCCIFFSKLLFKYAYWMAPLVTHPTLSREDISRCKNLIYGAAIRQSRCINASPIIAGDDIYFPGFEFTSWATSIVDLSSGLDEALNKFKRQASRPIAHAEKVGVVVRQADAGDMIAVSNFMNLYANYNNKLFFDKSLINLIKDFQDLNDSEYHYSIFTALHQEQIIGVMGIYGYGGFISEWGVFNSPVAKAQKLYPQDLIKKSILQYCIQNRVKKYDLSGFNPGYSISDKELGIKNFKRKFGGSDFIYLLVSS